MPDLRQLRYFLNATRLYRGRQFESEQLEGLHSHDRECLPQKPQLESIRLVFDRQRAECSTEQSVVRRQRERAGLGRAARICGLFRGWFVIISTCRFGRMRNRREEALEVIWGSLR